MNETDHSGNTHAITRTADLSFSGTTTINGTLIIEAANIVNLTGNMNCQNAGDIAINSGVLDLNSWTLNTTGNITVTGTIKLTAASVLTIAHNKSITVYGGGTFMSIGSPINNASVTHNGTGNYVFNI